MTTTNLTSWDPLREIPDLAGKTVFITGGNKGLGLVTVKLLALRGAKVYVGTRDEARTRTALAGLRAENEAISENQITRIPLDILDLASIVEAAAALSKLESKLDILSEHGLLLSQVK